MTLTSGQIDPGKFLLFLHLQKTAGMTLQELLRKHLGPGLLTRSVRYFKGTSGQSRTLEDALRMVRKRDRVFMGHFCYGVHRLLDFDTTYITLLRDPVKRLVSLYHYSHTTPTAHYYKVARTMTPEEFLLKCRMLELDNGMTRLIAGDEDDLFINRTPYGECDQRLLEKAKANLERDFSFVGIQEEFDPSVLLLGQRLGWKSSCYLTLNVRKTPPSQESDELKAIKLELARKNHLDLELYDYCRKRFRSEFEQAFPDPEKALAEFRKKNRQYQQVARPLFAARQLLTRTVKKIW